MYLLQDMKTLFSLKMDWMKTQEMLKCRLPKKSSLNACLSISCTNLSISCTLSSTPSITKMMFIDVTFYPCCDLITLIRDTDWSSSSLKFWDPGSARIGRKKNRWWFWNVEGREQKQEWGYVPKHLGHRHLELTIILSTQLLWFGMHCVENWSQRETEEKQRWLLEGVERIYQSAWCDVCGAMCFVSWVSALHIEAVTVSTMSMSVSWGTVELVQGVNPYALRKCF